MRSDGQTMTSLDARILAATVIAAAAVILCEIFLKHVLAGTGPVIR